MTSEQKRICEEIIKQHQQADSTFDWDEYKDSDDWRLLFNLLKDRGLIIEW